MTASPIELSVTCARSFSSNSASAVRRTVNHAVEGLRQQVSVEAVLQEIILCSTLYRQLGDILILRGAEDQDRNLRRGAKDPIEGLDSLAVGQKEVDQHCRYVIGPARFRAEIRGQSFQAGSQMPDPNNLEESPVRASQGLSYILGVR